jgi:2-polyprenyl-6-methoxyphenol hydroxylase-like FAD-dependent oxidoreductase
VSVTARRLETQVIVVGAGPVGLMLAGELRLGGADVLVLEQLAAPVTESRASTLHARTMEIFDSRGLLDSLGSPPRDMRGHFGGIPLDLSLPSPYAGQWKVPQTRTEELLEAWARGLGARVLRGSRLRALRATADQVEVVAAGPDGPVRIRAEYLVGCDGASSTVRELTGTPFPGRGARRFLLRADVAGIDIPDRRFQRLEKGLAIASRGGNGVTRVMMHEFDAAPPSGPQDAADVAACWQRLTGEDISGGRFLWVNAFGDVSRQVACYRTGRVLFAGDAAHDQMPAGGQALNLGLQDAVNLGWKLAAEVAGTAPVELLDTYHSERHGVARRTLSNIRVQGLLLLHGPEVEPLRTLVAELIQLPDVRAHLAAMICGLDIRYDVGEGEHPLLGVRLPPASAPAPSGFASTAGLLRAGRGVLLALDGDKEGRLRDLLLPWDGRVTMVAAAPEPGGDAVAALVRPDGYVAWTLPGGVTLPSALRRWFGAASPVPAGGRLTGQPVVTSHTGG